MEKTPWKQELIWCRRNEQGVLVNTAEILPFGQNFIPTVFPIKSVVDLKPKKKLEERYQNDNFKNIHGNSYNY